MDIGLRVEYDGKKNVVLAGEIIKEYPIGGLMCEYARLRPTELKEVILRNPFWNEESLSEKGGDALYTFYNDMVEKFDVVIAGIVIADFSSFLRDYLQAERKDLIELIDRLNCDKDEDSIKQFILKDTGFQEFGISTVGQAFLSAYCSYALSYVLFKHTFEQFVLGNEIDDEQIDKILSLYSENVEQQEFDFSIMLYEGKFHSVYSINSSLSLIVFEMAHAIDTEAKIVKCRNCNNYFVPVGRADSVYCGYPSPQDVNKDCRDIGAQATRAKKMKNDVVTQEYRRLYMRLTMGIKRHPEDLKLQMALADLTKGMKKLRKQRAEGTVSSDDILEWIHSMDSALQA